MNKYETIIIMDNEITEEQRSTVISRVRDYILANGKITKEQIRKIAETKMPDLNAASIEAAMSMVAGTARSMGVEVVD